MKSSPSSSRRHFLKSGSLMAIGVGTTLGIGGLLYNASSTALLAGQAEGRFEVNFTPKEWQRKLTSGQYAILRKESTEPRHSSALLGEKRVGNFHCAGCDLPVYPSKTKYDSRTGWPSFWASLPNAVGTKADSGLFMARTEVHCRRCGGHFGHIFDDGPQPTGKRHCINGLALTFQAKTA